MFIARLKAHQFDVMDYLAENLMMLRRSKEGLGLCMKHECVMQFKNSDLYRQGNGMIEPNQANQPSKCFRCKTVVAPFEDSFCCVYCHEPYCPSCLGYTKFFDMDELLALIMQ